MIFPLLLFDISICVSIHVTVYIAYIYIYMCVCVCIYSLYIQYIYIYTIYVCIYIYIIIRIIIYHNKTLVVRIPTSPSLRISGFLGGSGSASSQVGCSGSSVNGQGHLRHFFWRIYGGLRKGKKNMVKHIHNIIELVS